MLLKIVWRNPLPLTNIYNRIEKVASDKRGAVYQVLNDELREEFELITGGHA